MGNYVGEPFDYAQGIARPYKIEHHTIPNQTEIILVTNDN